MVYPNTFIRLQVIGTGYPGEMWSWGLNLAEGFGVDAAGTETVPQGVIDAVTAFHTSPGLHNVRAQLTTIKYNLIGPDGKYVNTAASTQADLATPVGGGGTLDYPPQIALAVTLRTSAKRGYANSGRFYMPYPALPLDDSVGTLTEANALSVANAATTMLDAINTASGLKVSVMSDYGSGQCRPVLGVEVGRAFDTIRRRRNQLEELYKPATSQLATV